MPKRTTVKSINCEKIESMLSKKHWSNAALCRELKKHERWISEVKRGRNLPSPEEAARICVLLECLPEHILTEEEDVKLVLPLLDGQKEKPAPSGDGLSELRKKAYALLESASEEKLAKRMAALEALFDD